VGSNIGQFKIGKNPNLMTEIDQAAMTPSFDFLNN
jgi:hypothetical protein